MLRLMTAVLTTALMVASWCGAGEGQGVRHEFFVAPGGSDENPGTKAKPFATLERARDAIRAMKKAGGGRLAGGVTVWLRKGVYHLARSFELTAQDSGTATAPIVYRAFGAEKVSLNGGRRIAASHFKFVTDPAVLARVDAKARGKLVQLDMKAEGITDALPELPVKFSGFTRANPIFLELFCNGQRMQVARWPNEGFAHFDEIVDTGSGLRDGAGPKRPGRFSYKGDRPKRWDVVEGVWLWGYWARAYVCDVVRVGKIDTAKREIEWAVPLRFGLDTWGAKRFFAYNVFTELDSPGEWFLDRKSGILYFWPPAPLGEAEVVVSMLKKPVVVMKGASHITVRGVSIECGRGDAVAIDKGSHCRIVGCTIRNVGHNAVVVTRGDHHGVVGCDIHHVGYAGIRLSGGDRKTLTPAGHYAVNNHIHHCSRVRRTHAGPLSLRGVGCRAAHNLIHHARHSAVWYWGNDHVMEFNEIYWAHTETSEGGVFYIGRDWTTRGNVIRHNYIHHINDSLEGSPTGINVVHLDDCVAGTTFVGNVCYRVGRGVSICGGPDNIVDNNIFVDCQLAVSLQDRGLRWWTWTRHPDGSVTAIDTRSGRKGCSLLTRLKRVPYNKPPYTKYPHLADMLDRDPVAAPWFCRITRNISVGGRFSSVSRGVKPEWVTIADNWDEGAPGFVDIAKADFRLTPGAPALKTGYKPIPFDKIGLVNDGTRPWPVRAEPPPKDWKPRWMVIREQQAQMPTALPVVAVKRAAAAIAIDGVVDAKEWNPGEAAGVVAAAYEPTPLAWTASGEKAKLPSHAWIECDDAHLYVAFVNRVDPVKGVSGGHRWGKDDAVEIALSVVKGKKVGDIIVLRGYTDGHVESSDEAGAPKAMVARALQGVRYAAKVAEPGLWTAEWKIPFASLGIEPRKHNPKLLFNLSVRKIAGDLWVMWKSRGGYTWDVRKGGFLWLEPFGDVAFSGGLPSQARIDVDARPGSVVMKPVRGCQVANWAPPHGARLTTSSDDLRADRWRTFSLSFVPDRDGAVTLNLMGRANHSVVDKRWLPVWVYFDDITVEGATLTNGGFENLDAKGRPVGWTNTLKPAFLIPDPKAACTGRHCVKVWHNGRYVQKLKVAKGRPVTITAKVRGEPVK